MHAVERSAQKYELGILHRKLPYMYVAMEWPMSLLIARTSHHHQYRTDCLKKGEHMDLGRRLG